MHWRLSALAVCVALLMGACGGGSGGDSTVPPQPTSWETTKAATALDLYLPAEFSAPQRLSNATMGWEDGLNVSRDGLHLYATYIPADFLSFVQNGDLVENLQDYDRGPHYDMDLVTNPTGNTYPWYHSDIIYASRASVNEAFSPWQTSGMKRDTFSEGAVSTVFSDSSTIEYLAFTSNEEYTAKNNIKIIINTTPNPTGIGTFITPSDTSGTASINTNYVEDNPHIERIDATTLVLFFDSEDRPGGAGGHDIWYAESTDNGATWSTPSNVTSVNTAGKEHQPHLYNDGSSWWLYFSAENSDNKLAIFRARQGTVGDWNSWEPREVVIGAGNAGGVGEPTLTANGDLYFIVVEENPDGTTYDRYDGDPWCALRK